MDSLLGPFKFHVLMNFSETSGCLEGTAVLIYFGKWLAKMSSTLVEGYIYWSQLL